MQYSKWLVWFALAGAVALPGASTLAAQDVYGSDGDRDISHDYRHVDRLCNQVNVQIPEDSPKGIVYRTVAFPAEASNGVQIAIQ